MAKKIKEFPFKEVRMPASVEISIKLVVSNLSVCLTLDRTDL